jgi:hypothetical protein
VDYPARARLKIYAKTEIVSLNTNSELFESLNLGDYKFRPERIMLFNIEAYDWNCPQHITPRYTMEEIKQAFAPQQNQLTKLEAEIRSLKAQLNSKAN